MKKYLFTPIKSTGHRKAFTLIEILIVIALLTLLMATLTQMIGGVGDSQGRARAKTDMALIAAGLEAFNGQYGGYPRISSAGGEVYAGGELYKCMAGKMMLTIKDDQIIMAELGIPRKPFIDTTKIMLADPNDPYLRDVDPEKNGVYFVDPWLEPYLYFYDTSTFVGDGMSSSWKSPSYILLSKGPDQKETDSMSMYTTGIIPDTPDYMSNDENVDNIIQGRDE